MSRLIARTWQVQPEQAAALAVIADDYQVSHSELARALLDYALSMYLSGRLRLAVRPTRFELVRLEEEREE